MPKPVPPPPPQPSVEETVEAVRFLRRVMLAGLAFFLLVAATYRYDSWLMDYGRDDGHSWVLWRARQLDEAAIRAHPGGKVAWLVGSSIMRDAFDEDAVNAGLAERGSPWRVVKLGMPRGTAGITIGLLDELPIRPGDRVFHTVAMDNFRVDWIHHTGISEDRLARFLDPAQMATIPDWSAQERLEYLAGMPFEFYRWHEPTMAGVNAWIAGVWWLKPPKKKKPGQFLRFARTEHGAWGDRAARLGEESGMYIGPGEWDFGERQFNARGLGQIRAYVDGVGAELVLVDVPYRPSYRERLLSPEALAAWNAWRDAQPELHVLPELPDDHYYDMRHPNSKGRPLFTAHLVEWMPD